MVADWSVECSADDPVLVVPWAAGPDDLLTPDLGPQFVDLRENPYDLDQVPEAEQHPALMHALRALNANRSPVFTAKCDAWTMSPQECADLVFDLAPDFMGSEPTSGSASRSNAGPTAPQDPGVESSELTHGFASYIDLIWRERSVYVSFHQQEQLLHRLARQASSVEMPHAALDCTLRPALVDLAGPQEGFAVTLYVKALGVDESEAYRHWTEALGAAVSLVRSRDLSLARPAGRHLQLPHHGVRTPNGGE